MGADVQFDAGWVLISIPKGLVVLSRQTFLDGLKRGKGWKRREALARRAAQEDISIARKPLVHSSAQRCTKGRHKA